MSKHLEAAIGTRILSSATFSAHEVGREPQPTFFTPLALRAMAPVLMTDTPGAKSLQREHVMREVATSKNLQNRDNRRVGTDHARPLDPIAAMAEIESIEAQIAMDEIRDSIFGPRPHTPDDYIALMKKEAAIAYVDGMMEKFEGSEQARKLQAAMLTQSDQQEDTRRISEGFLRADHRRDKDALTRAREGMKAIAGEKSAQSEVIARLRSRRRLESGVGLAPMENRRDFVHLSFEEQVHLRGIEMLASMPELQPLFVPMSGGDERRGVPMSASERNLRALNWRGDTQERRSGRWMQEADKTKETLNFSQEPSPRERVSMRSTEAKQKSLTIPLEEPERQRGKAKMASSERTIGSIAISKEEKRRKRKEMEVAEAGRSETVSVSGEGPQRESGVKMARVEKRSGTLYVSNTDGTRVTGAHMETSPKEGSEVLIAGDQPEHHSGVQMSSSEGTKGVVHTGADRAQREKTEMSPAKGTPQVVRSPKDSDSRESGVYVSRIGDDAERSAPLESVLTKLGAHDDKETQRMPLSKEEKTPEVVPTPTTRTSRKSGARMPSGGARTYVKLPTETRGQDTGSRLM